MSLLPSLATVTFTDRKIHVDTTGFEPGPDAVLKSTVVDSGASPTTTIRKGCMIVKETGDGLFYLADDSAAGTTGDRATQPAKSTTGHTDGNGTIKIVGNHGTISVTTTTGAGTEANNATDLNANADFADHYEATSGGGELTITAKGAGPTEWFYIHSDTMATAPFTEGESNGVVGTEAEYYVTEEEVSMLDPQTGAVADRPVRTSRRAYYDESELLHATAEGKASLARRGSMFG